MSTYSHSKVQLFNQCPLKFRFQHIDKYPAQFETTADLVLGNAVHDILEKLYNQVNDFKTPELDSLIEDYHNFWDKKLEELQQKGEELVIKAKDSTIDDYKNRGEVYIKNYFNKHYPFEDIKVVDTEANIYFDLDENIKFNGFIDRLDKSASWNTFIINDYKTNKRLPEEDKQDYFHQLTIYAKWVLDKYWKYFDNLKARIYYLHFDIEDEWDITESLLEDTMNKYKSTINDIESRKEKYQQWDTKAFEPNQTPLCNFCEFQSICPLFSHSYMNDEFVSNLSDRSIKTLIDDFWRKNEEKKKLEKDLNEMKNIFVEYVNQKEEDIEKIYWNDYEIKIKENQYYKYPQKEQFLERLKQYWDIDKVMDISFQKVKKAFDSEDIDIENYKDVIEKSKSYTPYTSKRKK